MERLTCEIMADLTNFTKFDLELNLKFPSFT